MPSEWSNHLSPRSVASVQFLLLYLYIFLHKLSLRSALTDPPPPQACHGTGINTYIILCYVNLLQTWVGGLSRQLWVQRAFAEKTGAGGGGCGGNHKAVSCSTLLRVSLQEGWLVFSSDSSSLLLSSSWRWATPLLSFFVMWYGCLATALDCSAVFTMLTCSKVTSIRHRTWLFNQNPIAAPGFRNRC